MLMGSITYAQVQIAWFNYPGGVSVATDASNNVYTANWDYNAGGDITLTKRDAAGNILWEVPYNNTDNTKHEVATWVETDGAGNILVSGTIRSGYSNPVNAASLLMKYNPAGTLLWRVVYESSFDGSSTNKCIVDANNNIYVLGIGTGPIGQVTKVKKFNSSGVSVWNYFDTGGGAPITFKFTPDNNIVIVKRSITGIINAYSKIDLNGNLIWNTAGITSISGGDAAGDAIGNTYIVNGSPSELKKLSPTGTVLWTQPNSNLNCNKVEVGTDNNPVVGGYPSTGYGVVVMKYNSNGNLIWQNLDADGPSLSLLALAPMKLDASNAAYIAGSTMSSMGLCKVNSDGSSAWAATTSSGYPVWFKFGTDNSIYIVGGTTARFIQSGTIPSPPAVPSNLVATPAGTSSIKLTWADNSTNETSFVLMQSSTSGGIFNKLITIPANTTSYTDIGLGSSATYYYKIQATNAGGNSSWSNEASAKTDTPPATIPAAPSTLIATASGTSVINLAWTDNATNETSCILQRSLTSGSGFATIATLASNTTSYSNTGLSSSTTYFYRVQASNSNGSSAWSNVANATTALAPPAAPSNLVSSAAGCSSIKLTWVDKSNNETSFELRRSTSLSGTYSTIATLTANTRTYTNTGLTTGRKYYYKVRAKNSAGNSAYSNTVSATVSCPTLKSGEIAESADPQTGVVASDIRLYPNPASDGWINLKLPSETIFPVSLCIYSMTGKKVMQKELYNCSNTFETYSLENGLYILTVQSKENIQKLKLQIYN
jgi:fibronectin type 3 domain-containing protein